MASLESLAEPPQAGAPVAKALERSKYKSPPPPVSSMTPPPSTQTLPAPEVAGVRTPTPSDAHLSSPPPTVKVPHTHIMPDFDVSSVTAEQVATAPLEELRTITQNLIVACRDAKTSVSHHKLQYQLLLMEKAEALNRMAVELEITHREVEILQVQQRNSSTADLQAVSAPKVNASEEALEKLQTAHRTIEADNQALRARLDKAKSMILDLGNQVCYKMEESDRLRKRIRDNRSHFNLLRRASEAGIASPFRSPSGAKSTPRDARSGRLPPAPSARSDEPFAQLLLADQVLSQESVTNPSTPMSRAARKANHIRGSHSLSALPSTPYHHHVMSGINPAYSSLSAQKMPFTSSSQPQPNHTRRFSRDSTISASDLEDRADLSEDDIPESQASQEAASMLRKSAARQSEPLSAKSSQNRGSHLTQAKISGAVTKPHTSSMNSPAKRKHGNDFAEFNEPASKKSRITEGIGLGIKEWSSQRA